MQIGNQFRCYPTPKQAETLLQWIGCQRFIYNAKVREDRYFRKFAKHALQLTGQSVPLDQQYAQFKSDLNAFLYNVPSTVLRNGAVLWKQAYSRYFAKLANRPTLHRKHGRQAVWLTSDMFKFEPVVNEGASEVKTFQLHIGTKKFHVGKLSFHAHKEFNRPAQVPNSIHISINAGRWYLSFNYEDGAHEPMEADVIAWLSQHSEQELQVSTTGLDRGVNIPLVNSEGMEFRVSKIQQKRIVKQDRHKKRWQRRLARRIKGSAGYAKARRKLARYQRYAADVRKDLAHKISYTLASNPQLNLFVFEALKIKNMTKRAKAKQGVNGLWLKNGAKAKSSLNKGILASVWGKVKTFTHYKAIRLGKLVIEVPPLQSSQECAICGYIHQDNRKTQSEFVCLSCGNQDNADHNAAKVIKNRGIKLLLNGKIAPKKRKRARFTKQVGAGCSELAAKPTSMETAVSRCCRNANSLVSVKLETHATNQRF